MKAIVLALSTIGALFLFSTANASAQAQRTYVSGVGDDANPCSRTAPCKSFSGAIIKTVAGGEISCLEPGEFGGLVITKSIVVTCDPAEDGILNGGAQAVLVNAGQGDVVFLRGLDIETAPLAQPPGGTNGIKFLSGAELHVSNCIIRGAGAGGPPGEQGNGILFNNVSNARLFVSDTLIENNVWSGIQILPSGSANANVMISRVRSDGNGVGFLANGTASGSLWMNIEDSTAAGNVGFGVSATGNAQVMLNRIAASHNGKIGIVANKGGTVRLGDSTITGNGLGTYNNGGKVLSYGNNLIDGNRTDGAPPQRIPAH